MIINALIINTPTSPNISMETYFPPTISQLESSSSGDDDSENENTDSLQTSSNSKNVNDDIKTWHYQLAKSLITMYYSMHSIITGFEETLQSSDTKTNLQHDKIKLEMMRMALMLNPSELPTYHYNELLSPYTDFRRLDDDATDHLIKRKAVYQHETLRSKIERIILRLKRGMEKLRLVLFSSSYQDKSLHYIPNYRQRLRSSLSDIREQLIEYNRINQILEEEEEEKQDDELTKHQKTISQIITEMESIDPCIQQRIEDYKSKLTGRKEKYEFISSPWIPLESQDCQKRLKTNNEHSLHIEALVFPDLSHEANEFFEVESAVKKDDVDLPLLEAKKENNLNKFNQSEVLDLSLSNSYVKK